MKTHKEPWRKKHTKMQLQKGFIKLLKCKYGLRNCIKKTEIAQQITKQAVVVCSNLRTYFSLDVRKPSKVHLNPNIKYKS
jgi:putative transposase